MYWNETQELLLLVCDEQAFILKYDKDKVDAAIAEAVAAGIEEAAVTAGWQAYFDTLAAGGSEAEANANASADANADELVEVLKQNLTQMLTQMLLATVSLCVLCETAVRSRPCYRCCRSAPRACAP